MTILDTLLERGEYAIRGVEASDLPGLALESLVPLELPLIALRALMPLPQTVKGDGAVGLHIETCLVPAPPPVFFVPTPMPVLFVGFVDRDPFEALVWIPLTIGEFVLGAGGGNAKVSVDRSPASYASMKATGFHFPLGGYVPSKLMGDAELVMGSASVDIHGHHAVRLGELGMSCMFMPVRAPSTRVLSLRPVVTGGQSVIDMRALVAVVIDTLVGELLALIPWPARGFVQAAVTNAYLQLRSGHPDANQWVNDTLHDGSEKALTDCELGDWL